MKNFTILKDKDIFWHFTITLPSGNGKQQQPDWKKIMLRSRFVMLAISKK